MLKDKKIVKYFFLISYQNTTVVGGVRKMAVFADFKFYLCWRRVSGWVWKSIENCLRNIGMVPYGASTYSRLRNKRSPTFINFWIVLEFTN